MDLEWRGWKSGKIAQARRGVLVSGLGVRLHAESRNDSRSYDVIEDRTSESRGFRMLNITDLGFLSARHFNFNEVSDILADMLVLPNYASEWDRKKRNLMAQDAVVSMTALLGTKLGRPVDAGAGDGSVLNEL
jgi:hypothetical protein